MAFRTATVPLLALLVLAPLSPAQNVFVVAPAPGPGIFAMEIQPAVDASASGDIVLVRAGIYAGFTVDGKGITVVADTSSAVTVRGEVVVRNVAAGASVVLQVLHVTKPYSPALEVTSNAGAVSLEGCTFVADVQNGPTCRVDGCASVTFHGCLLQGGSGVGSPFFVTPGGRGLHATNSGVTIMDSICQGGHGVGAGIFSLDLSSVGGDGAVLTGGLLFASGAIFQGGAGGNNQTSLLSVGSQGGDGLHLNAPAYAMGCTFECGAGGASYALPPAPDGAAISGTPPTFLSEPARHMLAESPVRELQTMSFSFVGTPGEIAAVIVSTGLDPAVVIPPFNGPLLVSLGTANAISFGPLPALGAMQQTLPIPALPPALLGATLDMQGVFFDLTTPVLVLGPGNRVILLDQSL